jgi:hypothetical protein
LDTFSPPGNKKTRRKGQNIFDVIGNGSSAPPQLANTAKLQSYRVTESVAGKLGLGKGAEKVLSSW